MIWISIEHEFKKLFVFSVLECSSTFKERVAYDIQSHKKGKEILFIIKL